MTLNEDVGVGPKCSAGEAEQPGWKEEMERLKRLVYEDEMTGLPNFRRFREDFRCRIDSAEPFLVGYVDVDHFKRVNDQYGHGMGDRILKQSGWRIAEAVGDLAKVYRKGGDEFLLLSDCPEQAGQLSDRLQSAFQKPFLLDEQELHVGISAGYSLCPDHSREEKELLHLADMRMFAVKHKALGIGTCSSENVGS